MIIDTHAHLQFRTRKGSSGVAVGFEDLADVLERAQEAGVTDIINVGVTPEDSRAALRLANDKQWAKANYGVRLHASAGIHPHDAGLGDQALDVIHDMAEDVIAIGECGLDYFQNSAAADLQEHMLRSQIEIALEHNLPLIFHVRDAWDDFFRVIDEYPTLRGVIHSFTGHTREVVRALAHPGELYFGLNGIMTFTRDDAQLEAAREIPQDRLLLETDCPFLAPVPYRGKRNEPAYLPAIVSSLATLRGVAESEFACRTTVNAHELFGLDLEENEG